MSLPLEIFDLLLYFVQQLGIMLAVGGDCVVLVAFLLAIRDGEVTKEEKGFLREVRRVLETGLILIIFSGIAITVLQYSLGQLAIVLEPAFLFKWLLIAIVSVLLIIDRAQTSIVRAGLSGGTWLALFIVHVLAPETSWSSLLMFYAAWMLLFFGAWSLSVRLLKKSKHATIEMPFEAIPIAVKVEAEKPEERKAPIRPEAPKPIPAPVAMKPVEKMLPAAPLQPSVTPVQPAPIPQPIPPPAPKKPAPVFTDLYAGESFPYKNEPKVDTPMLHPHLTEEVQLPTPPAKKTGPDGKEGLQFAHEHVTPHLPAVRIMPRKPEDLDTGHHRAPLVKYG